MKNLTKEEPKNITLVLVNIVGGWVGCLETCSLSYEDNVLSPSYERTSWQICVQQHILRSMSALILE
jgi:hypothetical protein